jgi:hypothetical protein
MSSRTLRYGWAALFITLRFVPAASASAQPAEESCVRAGKLREQLA